MVVSYEVGSPDSGFECLVLILQAQTLVLQNQHRELEGWTHRVTILFVADSRQRWQWRYVIFSEKI